MLHYLYKNLKNFVTGEKFLFIIIVSVQIISVISIFFSYGIIKHYNLKNEVTQGTMLEMDIQFPRDNDEDIITTDLLVKNHNKIIETVKKKVSLEYVMASTEEYMIDASYDYSDGNIVEGESAKNTASLIPQGGRTFTKKELVDGSKVAIVCATSKKYDNDIMILNGEKYDVIAYALEVQEGKESIPFLMMPIMSLPQKAMTRHLILYFNSPIDINEYNALKEACLEAFGDKIDIPEFVALDDIEDTKTNNTIILSGIILILFAAVNYCMIYRYILEKRKRTLAIYRICGCTKSLAAFAYMIEMIGVSLLIFAILIPLYHYIFLPRIGKMFEYMSLYYNNLTYIKLLIAYMTGLTLSYAVLVIDIVRKTPLMLTKEGEI